MKNIKRSYPILASGLIAATLAFAPAAFAQYTGPTSGQQQATGAYTGPSSVPLMTAKQITENGKDDQRARLQGRIVSHDGGDNYTFADDSGRLPVEISTKRFPPGKPVSAEQKVELVGQIDKDWRNVEFEVEQINLLP
jgi:uncharacterized protein (TIGR00156 family)